jgi:hypothetical protein
MTEQCLGAPTFCSLHHCTRSTPHTCCFLRNILTFLTLSVIIRFRFSSSIKSGCLPFVPFHQSKVVVCLSSPFINQKWLFAFRPLSSSLTRIFAPRAFLIHVPPLQSRLPTPCQLTPWSNWSTCAYTDGVGGWQSQSRTVIQQAINADSCDEFLLVRNRSCTFDPYSVCGGQEKWFNLNSGQDVSRLRLRFESLGSRGHS